MNGLLSCFCIKTWVRHSGAGGRKVSKSISPCVSAATGVYISNSHMFKYMQSQGLLSFTLERIHLAYACTCVCVRPP